MQLSLAFDRQQLMQQKTIGPFDGAAGMRRKRRGQAVVAGNNREWTLHMRNVAEAIACLRCEARAEVAGTATSDDLRRYAEAYGMQPTTEKAWGGIFRGPHWVAVGRVRSIYKSNNARMIRVWRYVGAP